MDAEGSPRLRIPGSECGDEDRQDVEGDRPLV